jgi:hypothetical protein
MTTEVAGGVSFTLRDAGSESHPIKTVTRGSDLEDGPDRGSASAPRRLLEGPLRRAVER